MPAVPGTWSDVSFDNLRAQGAFLVSAKKVDGKLLEVTITAEKGGVARLKLPPKDWQVTFAEQAGLSAIEPEFMEFRCQPGGVVTLSPK